MAFVRSNSTKYWALKAIVLPFLHERRILLDKMQKFHKYFYFVLENDSSEEKFGGTANNIFFIAMDVTNFSYKVFNDRILLVRQVDFSDEVRKYGVPV